MVLTLVQHLLKGEGRKRDRLENHTQRSKWTPHLGCSGRGRAPACLAWGSHLEPSHWYQLSLRQKPPHGLVRSLPVSPSVPHKRISASTVPGPHRKPVSN